MNGASQIRLESYLFTQEALTEARDHLTDQGVFAMYNYYRENWLIDRLGNTAQQALAHPPCIDLFAAHQAVVTVAKDPANQQCADNSHVIGADALAPADDNAPFLYFRGEFLTHRVPVGAGRHSGDLGADRTHSRRAVPRDAAYADLFFMGAAFLLLETKNIATFALLFGTTWLVNALVFAGVLLVVLAAVEVTRRFRTPPLPVVFGGIAAALLVAYLVPPDALLPLPFWPTDRGGAAGVSADLSGQRGVRQAVRAGRLVPGRLRVEPARLDRRRLPRVQRAGHRLPQPLDRGGRALPGGLPVQAPDGDRLGRTVIRRTPE